MKIIVTIGLLILLMSSFLGKSRFANAGIGFNDTVIVKDYGYETVTTTYLDGKKNGKEFVIFQNGDTFEIRNFKNDLFDGPVVTFYPHHIIGSIRSYKEGYAVGSFKNFDTAGNLQIETFFDGRYRPGIDLWSGRQNFYERSRLVFT